MNEQDYYPQAHKTTRRERRNKRREVYYKIFVDGLLAFCFPSTEMYRYKTLLQSKGVKLENSSEEEYETNKNTRC
ncbi:hypothetical protein [Metallibacterium sp.]